MAAIGMNGGRTLHSGGFTLSRGQGPHDDYELVTARKGYECAHVRAQGQSLPTTCRGPIIRGEQYSRARQAWWEWVPVSVGCLLDAGVFLRQAPVESPAPTTQESPC